MNTERTPALFFQDLRAFVLAESRAQRERYQRSIAEPVAERERAGRCVPKLRFDGAIRGELYRFSTRTNDSDFREGDRVNLHLGDPSKPLTEGYWVSDGLLPDGREFIDLSLDHPAAGKRLERGAEYCLDSSFLDLSTQYLAALDELGRSERGRDRVLPLLMGKVDEEVDAAAYDEAFTAAESAGLNNRQQEAMAEGVATTWCSLIQGPPGTGKTRVLAQIVKARVERGERVLVTACTHRAIHEALRAIHRIMPEFDAIAKIGYPVVDPDLPVPQYEDFADSPFSKPPFTDERRPYVIGATPFGARSRRLNGVEFEAVLIDEASQMTLPLAIMAMLSADTYVIIGDPKQLPPVLSSCRPWEASNHSLFGTLGTRRDLVQLNLTYRLNTALAQWVGDSFYLGDLHSWEGARDRTLQLSGTSSSEWLERALAPEASLVWIPTQLTVTRQYSMEEAGIIAQLVTELHRRGHALEDIGIVTPFRRQARVIRNRLRSGNTFPLDLAQRIVIDTVERMQGQERSIIIISTAASEAGFIDAISEFLYLPQRLNVAVSRARTKAIVLASETFLATEHHPEAIQEAIEDWRSLRAASTIIQL